MWSQLVLATATAAQSSTVALSGSHTDVPRCKSLLGHPQDTGANIRVTGCGKPYMQGGPNFPPGGMLYPPAESPEPMLFVQLQTRYSIYDSSESQASFIVVTDVSHTHGESTDGQESPSLLDFEIRIGETGDVLLSAVANVSSTPQLFDFSLDHVEPRLKPYEVSIYGVYQQNSKHRKHLASAELYYLPRKGKGSTVKIDNLYGGMMVANDVTNFAFEPLLPFGFYTSCSGYLNYSLANVSAYKDLGFNAINPVCAFTDGNLDYLFDWLDETNVWYQYDMRGSYLNLSSIAEQVPLLKDRSALLSWYTADEPDGWQYALNSTVLAYDLLKELDPYHPTGLVLNCDNYYFERYSAGADYLMEDAYPIGINPTYSRPWNTTCNETYGDCGCDNCIGKLTDVSDRLDTFSNYQRWLERSPKPLWSVLQAFHGAGYWDRDPTAEETWVMILLSFNHMAKGVMSWVFPSSIKLNDAHAAFAKVATVPPTSEFLLNANPVQINDEGFESLDVAYWQVGEQYMVGLVNLDRKASDIDIEIQLPFNAHHIKNQLWGNVSWELARNEGSSVLSTRGVQELETSIVILQ